jgi:tetratricopeptide (TPR) repeat protein
MAVANPLLSLLQDCVVRVDVEGEFRGSGFFVAPGEVLTCAHVVPDGGTVVVAGKSGELTAEVVERVPSLPDDSPDRRFPALPDVALLRLTEPPPSHPCVHLDHEHPAAGASFDRLYLYGFTAGEHAEDAVSSSPAQVEYKGLLEEAGQPLFKLGGDQIRRGYSGSPLLNLRTGSVCAVVESSRDPEGERGGFGVPVSLIVDELPGLLGRNMAHHATDSTWQRAVEAEREQEERRRGGDDLNLLAPLIDLEWTPDYPPSELLRARYGVVGLQGREQPERELGCWRDSDRRFDIAVISGAGGYGKTRLALEHCARAQQDGWTAGLFAHDLSANTDTALDRLTAWPGRLLVAIDYAETRPALVSSLILRLSRRQGGPPARLILICRQAQAAAEQEGLFAIGDGRDEILRALRRAETIRLDQQPIDSQRLFEAGLEAFAERLGEGGSMASAPALEAGHFERPLFVLAAALLVAQDPGVDVDAMGREQLMLELLDHHEAQYWERSKEGLGPDFDLPLQGRAVAVATVLGADTEAEALALAATVAGLEEAGIEPRAVARWLSRLYGEGRLDRPPAIAPLEPDMLGEALVIREYTANPDLLSASLDAATDSQLVRALTVLTRAAASSDGLAETFRRALDERLPGLLERAAAADVELVTSLDLTINAVRPVLGAASVPRGGPERLVLGPLMPSVHRLAIAYHRYLAQQDRAKNLGDLAYSLNHLAIALHEVRRDEEALAPIEEAVDYLRELAAEDRERYLPGLNMALDHRAIVLNEIGRGEEGLKAFEEAVEQSRELVAEDRAEHLAGLASALNNFAHSLGEMGRDEAALEAIEESVGHFRELVERDRASYLPDLSKALNILALRLQVMGRGEDSLKAIREAVANYRELAEGDRARYLGDLAMSLSGLALRLENAGRTEDGLQPSEEAVAHYRELVAGDRERYLRDLAGALGDLMKLLYVLGRPEEALEKAEEVVDYYRELAANAPQYLPGLADALSNLSVMLENVGRPQDAVETMEETVAHYRELVKRDRARYLADLAEALNIACRRFENAGQGEAALAAVREAVEHREELVERDRVRYLPDLAKTMITLCDCLESAGQLEASLAAGEEAVKIYRELVESNAPRHLPGLAMALNNVTTVMGDLERHDKARETVEEAVKIYRELVQDNAAYMPSLTTALNNLAAALSTLQREDQARELIKGAIAEYGETPGSEGLLLSEAIWQLRNGDLRATVKASWEALDRATKTRNRQVAINVLAFLRQVRTREAAAFDEIWAQEVGRSVPPWISD